MTAHDTTSGSKQCIFFLTAFTAGHSPIFTTDRSLERLRTILAAVAREHRASVLGYVLMPEHLHLLVGCDRGGDLRAFMQDFLASSAGALGDSQVNIWRATYETVLICSEDDFYRRLQDMHAHPIRKAMTESATEFTHSSAAAWLCGAEDGITETRVVFGEE